LKKILKISLFILILTLFVSILTGCSDDDKDDNKKSKKQSKEKVKLEDKITIDSESSTNGELIVFLQNNNNTTIDLTVEAEFYDKEGNIIGTEEDLVTLGKSSKAALGFDQPDSFDTHKINLRASDSSDYIKSYHDDLTISDNNTGKEVIIKLKNTSKNTIESINVAVVFYKNDKIVGFDNNYEFDLKSNKEASMSIHVPYSKDSFEIIDFDDYEIFINDAYSYTDM